MKKVFAGVIAALGLALITGCSVISDAVQGFEYGSITVSTGDSARYLSADEIQKASIYVYANGTVVASKTGIALSGGKGNATVDNIPVGKNRIVEVIGYKAENIEGQRLYCVTDIFSGANDSVTICDGESSAKGKAYLALSKAGVDVANISISGFVSGKSSHSFDAEAFVQAYKVSSSADPKDFYTACGVVNLTNISKAAGYTVWIADPVSSKLTITSNSVTSEVIEDVAPGTWTVYVNDGKSVTAAGTVTCTNGSGTFDGLIGQQYNPFDGKVLVFVKPAQYKGIYLWTEDSEIQLAGVWPGTTLNESNKATKVYMKNPDGWYMLDVTDAYNECGQEINLILNGNGQTKDIKTGKKATFWYDHEADEFYDEDPTAGQVDTDVSLSDVKVNGVSIGSSVTSYTVGKNVSSASVTAVASSESAVVTVSPDGEVSIANGDSKSFEIYVSNNGNSAVYTLTVSRASQNDTTLSSITVDGNGASINGNTASLTIKGSEDTYSISSVKAVPVDSEAAVSYTSAAGSISDGGSKVIKITVANGTESAVYTLTVTYEKQTGVESDYYWTNKNGKYGANKTISTWSDWTEDMKIAQGAANDDPRVFCSWSMHENPYDAYAMYAAYDSTNLYIMLELPNVQDIVAPGENYPLSDNGQFWNRATPFFFAFDTGKGAAGDGSLTDGTGVWGNDVKFSANNVNRMIACHSLPSKGTPGVFIPDSDGKFSYKPAYCLTWTETGVSVDYDGGANKTQGLVSKNLYGIKEVGMGQGRSIDNVETDTYVDFYSSDINHNKDYDLKWQITIPLSALDVDEAYIKSHGIGVMFVMSDGASGMDCLPWDPSMVDNAAVPYSQDSSSSAEKEDSDVITVPFARIGK